MVAFVNGKFTNASAHTSYLILLKNIPAIKNTAAESVSDDRFGRFTTESPPGAGRARHYIWTSCRPSIYIRKQFVLPVPADFLSGWRINQAGGAL